MKRLIILAGFIGAFISISRAQEPDSKKPQEMAKTFIRQGDYNNAIVVLKSGLQQEPGNLEMLKDLAFVYYLQRDYVKALETAKPLAERTDADVQAYQILGLVYKAIEERKDCEKMYKAALKKFPNSGVLYNEYGEMLWSKKDYAEAVKWWEKGIERDPNHSGNYYNAAKFYFFSTDKVWALIYGETFVNLESYSKRTVEIKNILLEAYKKLFSDTDIFKNQDSKNEFVKVFLETMKKHSTVVASGITPETITALRTRFILDWYEKYASRFPLRLFENQRQMLKSAMFNAYDQWIFGAATDLTAYQNWTTSHSEENNEFTRLQKNRVFKIPGGQYYQTVSK